MKYYQIERYTRIKDQVKACYAFLSMEWGYLKEATIIGKNGSLKDAVTFTDPNMSFEDFWQCYRKNRMGIMCMGAHDRKDTKRIGLVLMPESIDEESSEVTNLLVTDYADSKASDIDHFFRCLHGRMDEVQEV